MYNPVWFAQIGVIIHGNGAGISISSLDSYARFDSEFARLASSGASRALGVLKLLKLMKFVIVPYFFAWLSI